MSFFIRCESKNNEIRILRREDVDLLFFNDLKENNEWHYGLLNKTHYILDSLGKIIGCFNLILLSKYNNKHLFYFDTIEIHKDYRGQGIGTRAVKYIIKIAVKEYENYNIFLLVAKCNQNKLKFFGKLGFVPIKLRKTKLGEHCIMSYPFNEYSGALCQKLFDYFHWREEKKEVISSDCKYAYDPNPTGLYWCAKKNIYTTGLEKKNCRFYIKCKEIFHKREILDLEDI